MIPSFHNKWHFHFKLVFESRPSNGAPAMLTKITFTVYVRLWKIQYLKDKFEATKGGNQEE